MIIVNCKQCMFIVILVDYYCSSADYNTALKQAKSQQYVTYFSHRNATGTQITDCYSHKQVYGLYNFVFQTVYIAFSATSSCLDQLLAVITMEVFEYLCSTKDLSDNKLLRPYSSKVNRLISSGEPLCVQSAFKHECIMVYSMFLAG